MRAQLCVCVWLLHPQRARGQGHGLPGAVQGVSGRAAGWIGGTFSWTVWSLLLSCNKRWMPSHHPPVPPSSRLDSTRLTFADPLARPSP